MFLLINALEDFEDRLCDPYASFLGIGALLEPGRAEVDEQGTEEAVEGQKVIEDYYLKNIRLLILKDIERTFSEWQQEVSQGTSIETEQAAMPFRFEKCHLKDFSLSKYVNFQKLNNIFEAIFYVTEWFTSPYIQWIILQQAKRKLKGNHMPNTLNSDVGTRMKSGRKVFVPSFSSHFNKKEFWCRLFPIECFTMSSTYSKKNIWEQIGAVPSSSQIFMPPSPIDPYLPKCECRVDKVEENWRCSCISLQEVEDLWTLLAYEDIKNKFFS